MELDRNGDMAIVKKHDFVEIEYTGRLKEGNEIFDTTHENIAKENGMFDKNHDYSPIIVCIGENNILKSLEDRMIGKETQKDYKFEIKSNEAFGPKDSKLIQLIPVNKFRQQNIKPIPGLKLNIDGVFGIVRTVSGGRSLVDFNHPLAGKDVIYDIKIKKVLEDGKEKLSALLKNTMNIKDAQVDFNESSATITVQKDIPKKAQEEFKKIAARTMSDIKNVEFIIKESKENK